MNDIENTFIDIETNLGCFKGILNDVGELLIANKREYTAIRSLLWLHDDVRPVFSLLNNPKSILVVESPDDCQGEWVCVGRCNKYGAWVCPPLVFKRVSYDEADS